MFIYIEFPPDRIIDCIAMYAENFTNRVTKTAAVQSAMDHAKRLPIDGNLPINGDKCVIWQ